MCHLKWMHSNKILVIFSNIYSFLKYNILVMDTLQMKERVYGKIRKMMCRSFFWCTLTSKCCISEALQHRTRCTVTLHIMRTTVVGISLNEWLFCMFCITHSVIKLHNVLISHIHEKVCCWNYLNNTYLFGTKKKMSDWTFFRLGLFSTNDFYNC